MNVCRFACILRACGSTLDARGTETAGPRSRYDGRPRSHPCGSSPSSGSCRRPTRGGHYEPTRPPGSMPTSGDVVDLDLGVPEGREAGFRHPAVGVTAHRILDAQPSVIHVVPVTSTIRAFDSEITIEPDPAKGLALRSAARCQHLRAVSPGRITTSRGNVGPAVLIQIRRSIAVLLDLPV
jgi:mRNA interferase MazF